MSHGARPSVSSLLQGLAALALLVAAMVGLERGGLTTVRGPVTGLGFLVIAGAVFGQLASFLKLPRLTGFLIAGILAGPQTSGLVSHSDVKSLSLISALALALIALQAGAELTLAALQRT